MCVGLLPTHMSMGYMNMVPGTWGSLQTALNLLKPELETRVSRSVGNWQLNPNLLQEQHGLLATEPSLSPLP